MFVSRTNATIGSTYTKAVYRQYSDASFTQQVGRAGLCWLHGAGAPDGLL